MAYRVAHDDRLSPVLDGAAIEPFDHLRIATRRIFGDVHHLEPERAGVLDGLLGRSEEKIVGPILSVTADGTGSEKGRDFNGDAHTLRDLCDRANVILMRPRCAVRTNLELRFDDLARQPLD